MIEAKIFSHNDWHSEKKRRRAYRNAISAGRRAVMYQLLGWLVWLGVGFLLIWLLNAANADISFYIGFLTMFLLFVLDWNLGYIIKNTFKDVITDHFLHEQIKDSLTDLVSDELVKHELKDIITDSVENALSNSSLDRTSRNFELEQIESNFAALRSELTRLSDKTTESSKTLDEISCILSEIATNTSHHKNYGP